MIGYAAIASHGFFNTYLRRETTTRFKNVRVDELQFPMVLLCNRNSFTKESVEAAITERNLTGLDLLLKHLFNYGQIPLPSVLVF